MHNPSPRRNRWAAAQPDTSDPVDAAHAQVADARHDVDAARRAVTLGEAGAASLATAEYKLGCALDHLAAVGGLPPSGVPPLDGDDSTAA